MKIEKTDQLKIKLKGEDIDNFKSALKKISAMKKQVGFSSSLITEDEQKVIDNIIEKL